MKLRTTFLSASLLVVITALTTQVISQQEKPKPDAPKHDAHEDQHGGPEAIMPGPVHELLGKYVGQWTTKSSFTMPGMEAPEPVAGISRITSELGGRFFIDQSSGEMMGEPYESRHYTGYNNATKQYEAVWTWTNDTGMLHWTGTSDDGGKTIKWNSSFVNEAGEKEALTAVTRHNDNDHFTIELRGEGENAAVMMTEYSRKK